MNTSTEETAGEGHNSGHVVKSRELKDYVERVENLDGQRKELGDDIREIKLEMKSKGYDIKAFNKLLQRRKLSAEQRYEQDQMLELYEGVFA